MDGAERAGPEPAAGAPLQPAWRAGLDGPVSGEDVLRGLAGEGSNAEEIRRMQESLRRRAADQRLVERLERNEFSGPVYGRFEEELVRYGLAVVRGWCYSGYIFTLTAARGYALHPTDREREELVRESDARDELADMTVARALPRFRERALVGGGWRYDGGASLATYFVGALVYQFPNEFRARRVQQRRWDRGLFGDGATLPVEPDHTTDPACIAVGDLYVQDHLDRLKQREQAAIALTLDGFKQQEIAELLQTTERAVEGVVHRWRTKEKSRLRRGEDR